MSSFLFLPFTHPPPTSFCRLVAGEAGLNKAVALIAPGWKRELQSYGGANPALGVREPPQNPFSGDFTSFWGSSPQAGPSLGDARSPPGAGATGCFALTPPCAPSTPSHGNPASRFGGHSANGRFSSFPRLAWGPRVQQVLGQESKNNLQQPPWLKRFSCLRFPEMQEGLCGFLVSVFTLSTEDSLPAGSSSAEERVCGELQLLPG